ILISLSNCGDDEDFRGCGDIAVIEFIRLKVLYSVNLRTISSNKLSSKNALGFAGQPYHQ
ncbi:MAG: hypothetical protein ACRC80_14100, partial [Waterburya sp.]